MKSKDVLSSFRNRYGEKHYFFLMHVAVPIGLTQELMQKILLVFSQDISGNHLKIPRIALADILFATFCKEVGYDVYEIKIEVRDLLITDLLNSPELGKIRFREVNNFLLQFSKDNQFHENVDVRDFMESQEISSLSYLYPGKAAQKIAFKFKNVDPSNQMELLRIALLVEALEDPLREYKGLIEYAKSIRSLVSGDIDNAIVRIKYAINQSKNNRISGVKVPIPKRLKRATIFNKFIFSRVFKFIFSILAINAVGFFLVSLLNLLVGSPEKNLSNLPVLGTKPAAIPITDVDDLSDVRQTDWAYSSIKRLVEYYQVIESPNGTFRGGYAINRHDSVHMLAKLILNICLLLEETNICDNLTEKKLAFNTYQPVDLSPDHWNFNSYKLVSQLTNDTLTYSDGRFRGYETMTRNEFIVLLDLVLQGFRLRFSNLGYNLSFDNIILIYHGQILNMSKYGIQDVDQLSDVSPQDWSYEHIRSLVEDFQCVNSYPNKTLRGEQVATRYEATAQLSFCFDMLLASIFDALILKK